MNCNTPWAEALRELTVLPGPGVQEEYGADNFLRAAKFRLEGRAFYEGQVVPFLEPGRTYTVVLGFVDRDVAGTAGIPGTELHHEFGSAILQQDGTETLLAFGRAALEPA